MTLLEKTRELRTRCQHLGTLQARLDETAALDGRLATLREKTGGLPEACATVELLRASNIAVETSSPAVKRTRERLSRISEKFSGDRKAATLTQGGRDWHLLLREVEELALSVRSEVATAWKRYASALYTGDAPHVLESRMARTDQNRQALKVYSQRYDEFRRVAGQVPTSAADIDAARNAASRLSEATRAFDFEVPGAVKRFFDALPRGGAPLTLLTEEVRRWLEARGQTDLYRVVARSP